MLHLQSFVICWLTFFAAGDGNNSVREAASQAKLVYGPVGNYVIAASSHYLDLNYRPATMPREVNYDAQALCFTRIEAKYRQKMRSEEANESRLVQDET